MRANGTPRAATPNSRSAYLAPAFTWLLAAGAVAIERLLPGRRQFRGVVYALAIVNSAASAA